jgi:hypothetical protein
MLVRARKSRQESWRVNHPGRSDFTQPESPFNVPPAPEDDGASERLKKSGVYTSRVIGIPTLCL